MPKVNLTNMYVTRGLICNKKKKTVRSVVTFPSTGSVLAPIFFSQAW